MYGDRVAVDSHLEIAEVPTENDICNAILNPQTLEQADIFDVGEGNSERPPSNKDIVETHGVLRKAVQHHANEKRFWAALLLWKHGHKLLDTW